MEMKFLFLDEVTPVIFSGMISHDEMAKLFPDKKPTSAGFVGFQPGNKGLHTYGDSHSLGIGPSKDDDYLINKFLGFCE